MEKKRDRYHWETVQTQVSLESITWSQDITKEAVHIDYFAFPCFIYLYPFEEELLKMEVF